MGKSGQDIIQAILSGERDAKRLVTLADLRCKSSKKTIEKSLVANWGDDLLFMLSQSYDLYLYYQTQMRTYDKKIENISKEYLAEINIGKQEKEILHSEKKKPPKNAVTIDIEKYAFQMWGINLMRIHGISDAAVLRLSGELGHDFTDKFASYKEFCC